MLSESISYTDYCRFESFYFRTSEVECWNWLGCTDGKGYAGFTFKGKICIASRVAYILEYGDFDQNMKVLHTCDNPRCVNPKHLFLGTLSINMKDMVSKNRNPNIKGENNPNSKLLNVE